jgi:hypothetical protein
MPPMMFSADAGAAAMSAMRVAVAMVSFMIASPWITIDEPVWLIRFLVASARMRDLLLRAKHLFVAAKRCGQDPDRLAKTGSADPKWAFGGG